MTPCNDGASGHDESALSFEINPVPVITTVSLPDGEIAISYSEQLTSTGGTAPVVWSDMNNDLSGTGLSLDANGLLSGMPTSDGTIQLTAELLDAAGATDSKLLQINVSAASCCAGMVGDANGLGGDLPTVSDISTIVDFLFISGAPLPCLDPRNERKRLHRLYP